MKDKLLQQKTMILNEKKKIKERELLLDAQLKEINKQLDEEMNKQKELF